MYEEDRGKAREYKKNRTLVQKIAATSTTINNNRTRKNCKKIGKL